MSCTCEMLLPGACSCSGLSLSRQPVELSSLVSIHTCHRYSEYLQLCSRPHASESAHGKTESGRSLRNKSGSLIWGENLTESKLVQGAKSTGWARWGGGARSCTRPQMPALLYLGLIVLPGCMSPCTAFLPWKHAVRTSPMTHFPTGKCKACWALYFPHLAHSCAS